MILPGIQSGISSDKVSFSFQQSLVRGQQQKSSDSGMLQFVSIP